MGSNGGESGRHRDLKKRALLWAQANGFPACATEVRVPRTGFRADVAGCALTRMQGVPGEVAVFECKQARADLLRDTADEKRTLEALRTTTERRAELERMVGAHLPDLRRGEFLFAEYDPCDLELVRHDGLRMVRKEEARLQARLYSGTKFDRLRRYRCADRHYLVVAENLIQSHEAPAGWGVLEACGTGLELRRRPERDVIEPAARLQLLQAVALAGTRLFNAGFGLAREDIEALRSASLPVELE